MKHFGLSPLRFKKLKELLHAHYGRCISFSRTGNIRYGRNIFSYVFRPKFTSLLESCFNGVRKTFNVPTDSDYTIDQIIDIAYSNFILGEYNLSNLGADYKFNTIRNVFKQRFKSDRYMVNHYAGKLSIPVIRLLKKEFADRDILNIMMPVRVHLLAMVRDIESGIIDHVRRQFSLMRAGPYDIRSPLTLVA
jgi:hypothetical protein